MAENRKAVAVSPSKPVRPKSAPIKVTHVPPPRIAAVLDEDGDHVMGDGETRKTKRKTQWTTHWKDAVDDALEDAVDDALEDTVDDAVEAAEDDAAEDDGEDNEEDDEVCAVCSKPDSEAPNEIVFCDGCDLAVHQKCYGILAIPRGEWLCKTCSGEDAAVDPGREDTAVPAAPEEAPDIPNFERHLRDLQRVLLDRCTGRRAHQAPRAGRSVPPGISARGADGGCWRGKLDAHHRRQRVRGRQR